MQRTREDFTRACALVNRKGKFDLFKGDNPNPSPRFSVWSSDIDDINFLLDFFQLGCIATPYMIEETFSYGFKISKQEDMLTALGLIYKGLGERQKLKADNIMKYIRYRRDLKKNKKKVLAKILNLHEIPAY